MAQVETSADVVRQELSRILATPAFRNSPLGNRLLTYVVNCALTGDNENLKEYVIGLEVFSRPETFDPRLDSVVRVHASQLRKKLRAYYEVNGANSTLQITIPPGSYKPVFQEVKDNQEREAENCAQDGSQSYEPGLLVLPCIDLDIEGGSSLSKGMTEELIMALTDVSSLRVVPAMAESSENLQALLSHVERAQTVAIVQTSVRCSGGRIRVGARLVCVSTLSVTWAKRFEELHSGDSFLAQQTLAGKIASAVCAHFANLTPPDDPEG
jgi:TolB-like protein